MMNCEYVPVLCVVLLLVQVYFSQTIPYKHNQDISGTFQETIVQGMCVGGKVNNARG